VEARAASSAATTTRAIEALEMGAVTPSRIVTSTRHGGR
jgi:hypothetical protein